MLTTLAVALALAGCHPTPPASLAADSAPPDSAVAAASAALERGLPWRASQLVAPALADSGRRTPEAVLLAATAASQWGGWGEVRRLLEPASWKDTLFQGRAHALLAQALLAEGSDSAAGDHARAAVEAADGSLVRGERLVLLARALDRLDQRDSAAAAYATAAELLPEVADWLYLRAAGVTADGAARAALYARVTGSTARDRILATEAAARERAGDLLGAARVYDSLGERVEVLRLELAAADSAGRDREPAERALLDFIEAHSGSGSARAAIAVLDRADASLSVRDELIVARSAAESGPLDRAAVAFERALNGGVATVADRYAYAKVLERLGRYDAAIGQFGRIPSTSRFAADAAYLRARSMVRSDQVTRGIKALVALGHEFPDDVSAASIALVLRADLATDRREDVEARALLLKLAERYPSSRHAPSARFRAAIIAFANGEPATAAAEFDALVARYPRSDEAIAARYWAGRAWQSAGDTAAAKSRWRTVLRREPLSYYAAASARRLGVPVWMPPAAPDSFVVVPALESTMSRAAALERLGLETEAGWEYARAEREADSSIERLLATADAFRTRGLASRSIRLAWRALDRGAERDARLYRLIYPITHRDALLAEATERGLDPAFVAALIRQESMFNPEATSHAGARGLMQLMPRVGRRVAESVGFPLWDPVLLYQGDVNLQLGTIHLEELWHRYDAPVHILAAYNAGASRVERWSTKVGVDDPELFAERIPYTETRDYVRIVQRNQGLYEALYDWPAETASAGQPAAATTGAKGGSR